jgi:hypothetical protein
MGGMKHPVRVVDGGGFAVPVRRQPPLVVGYEHFRLDRQGQLLSPKTSTPISRVGCRDPATTNGS